MQNVGLFTAAASTAPTIASGTILAETTGYAAEAKGAAVYAYDSSLTSSYVTAHPRSAFLDASGRVFRLADQMQARTPYMFGAVGDGTTDDSDALQACLDDAIPTANARANFYDLAGSWAVSKPIYAAYPSDDLTRRFRGGRLMVLPVSSQPGGVPMQDVLTITGTLQQWEGELAILDGLGGQTYYTDRRFHNGVHMMEVGSAVFETIRVDGARRDAVHVDGRQETWVVRAGTPQEHGNTAKNSIGLQIGKIFARGCGSSHIVSTSHGVSLTIAAKTQGAHNGDGVFISSPAGYGGSSNQRTKLDVGSSAELALYDIGKVRCEISSTTFTSIAADATGRTLTWTAGDPVTAGLQIGDRISLIDAGSVGANDGKVFEILGFSGTSNRQISVTPAPVTETAKAYSALYTDWSFHQIVKIESSSEISVSPWVPDRTNSKYYSMHGFVANVHGEDTANVRIGLSGGLVVAGNLRAGGLYGTKVETLLSDYGELGIQFGMTLDSVSFGNVVGHIHTEGVQVNILQLSVDAALDVKGNSLLELDRCHFLTPRMSTAAALPAYDFLRQVHLVYKAQTLDASIHGEHSGNNYFVAQFALSNAPANCDAQMTASGGTVTLDFDREISRLFGRHTAELFWIGTDGAAPTGTLTFQLATSLTDLGWSIVGSSSVTTAKPCFFKVRFYPEGKKAFVTRFDAV